MDYIRPRGLVWIKTTLRVTVAIQCFGAAAQWLSEGIASPVAQFLIHDVEMPEVQATQLDEGVAYGLLACGVLTVMRPSWVTLLPVSIWFSAVSLAAIIHDIDVRAVLVPVEQAIRTFAPLGLLVIDFWPPRIKSHLGRTVMTMWLLRLGIALTFAGLGLVAILQGLQSGPLLGVVQSVAHAISGAELPEEMARFTLAVIGGIELALAFNVLASRSRPMLALTAVWGFASAAVRMVDLGLAGFPESLVRIGEGGVPVVLLLYFSLSVKEFPTEIIPEN